MKLIAQRFGICGQFNFWNYVINIPCFYRVVGQLYTDLGVALFFGMSRCVDCDRVFGNNGALAIHRKYKHQRGDRPVQDGNCEMCVCPNCGNAFKGTGGLNVHRRACHPDVYHAARQPAARVTTNRLTTNLELERTRGIQLFN